MCSLHGGMPLRSTSLKPVLTNPRKYLILKNPNIKKIRMRFRWHTTYRWEEKNIVNLSRSMAVNSLESYPIIPGCLFPINSEITKAVYFIYQCLCSTLSVKCVLLFLDLLVSINGC